MQYQRRSGKRIRVTAAILLFATVGLIALEALPWLGAASAVTKYLAIPALSDRGSTRINSVSCVSDTFCVAVGDYSNVQNYTIGVADEWDGTAWHAMNIPDAALRAGAFHLNGVDCVSSAFCVAVGESGGGAFTEMWSGAVWRVVPSSDPTNHPEDHLSSVSCASPTMCVAVGAGVTGFADAVSSTPVSQRWDGTSWHLLGESAQSYVFGYDSVSCPTAASCMAIAQPIGGRMGTDSAPYSARLLSSGWQPVPFALPVAGTGHILLSAIDCTAQSRCTAVGSILTQTRSVDASPARSAGYTQTWNGTAWTAGAPLPPSDGSALTAIDCWSDDSCVAVGTVGQQEDQNQTGIVVTLSGSTRAPTATTGLAFPLNSVGCSSDANCMVLGYSRGYPSAQFVGEYRMQPRYPRDAVLAATLGVVVIGLGTAAAWRRRDRAGRSGIALEPPA